MAGHGIKGHKNVPNPFCTTRAICIYFVIVIFTIFHPLQNHFASVTMSDLDLKKLGSLSRASDVSLFSSASNAASSLSRKLIDDDDSNNQNNTSKSSKTTQTTSNSITSSASSASSAATAAFYAAMQSFQSSTSNLLNFDSTSQQELHLNTDDYSSICSEEVLKLRDYQFETDLYLIDDPAERSAERMKRQACLINNADHRWLSFSFVLVTRNDQFVGNSIGRTYRLIEEIVTFRWNDYRYGKNNVNNNNNNKMDNFVEIIIVEWNPDPTKPNLEELPAFKRFKNMTKSAVKARGGKADKAIDVDIRWIVVNKEDHAKVAKHIAKNKVNFEFFGNEVNFNLTDFIENCNVNEFPGKNIGARRARGDFVIHLTTDSLFAPSLLAYLARYGDSYHFLDYTLYSAVRSNIDDNINATKDVQYAYDESYYNIMDALQNANVDNEDLRAQLEARVELQCHFRDWPVEWGFGEFQMMSRKSFDIMGGFLESLQVFDVDSEIVTRVQHIYNWDVLNGNNECSVWHQWHPRTGSGGTKSAEEIVNSLPFLNNVDDYKKIINVNNINAEDEFNTGSNHLPGDSRKKKLNHCNQLYPIWSDWTYKVEPEFWRTYHDPNKESKEQRGQWTIEKFRNENDNSWWVNKDWGVPHLKFKEIEWK